MTPEECVAALAPPADHWRACQFPERPYDLWCTFADDCHACRRAFAAALRNGTINPRAGWTTAFSTGVECQSSAAAVAVDMARRMDDPILLAAVEFAEARA